MILPFLNNKTPPAIKTPVPVKTPPVTSRNATCVVDKIIPPITASNPPPNAVGAILDGLESRNVLNESLVNRSATFDLTSLITLPRSSPIFI